MWLTLNDEERDTFKQLLSRDRDKMGITEADYVISALPPANSRQWRRLKNKPGFKGSPETLIGSRPFAHGS